QHLTTTPSHHLHLRSVATATTTPFSDPSQPPPHHPLLRSVATTTTPTQNRHNYHTSRSVATT
ncbi:hypothetical protein A2U01_0104290, partial [Trifolium medium]|nr:hypothetical protein [Trifolium medium]